MHGNTSSKASLLQRIGLLLLCLSCGFAQASTVLEMNFEDVVSQSELVFEGQVLGLECSCVLHAIHKGEGWGWKCSCVAHAKHQSEGWQARAKPGVQVSRASE